MLSIRFYDERCVTLFSVFRAELGRSIPGTTKKRILDRDQPLGVRFARTLPDEDRRDGCQGPAFDSVLSMTQAGSRIYAIQSAPKINTIPHIARCIPRFRLGKVPASVWTKPTERRFLHYFRRYPHFSGSRRNRRIIRHEHKDIPKLIPEQVLHCHCQH